MLETWQGISRRSSHCGTVKETSVVLISVLLSFESPSSVPSTAVPSPALHPANTSYCVFGQQLLNSHWSPRTWCVKFSTRKIMKRAPLVILGVLHFKLKLYKVCRIFHLRESAFNQKGALKSNLPESQEGEQTQLLSYMHSYARSLASPKRQMQPAAQAIFTIFLTAAMKRVVEGVKAVGYAKGSSKPLPGCLVSLHCGRRTKPVQ